jgi:hypothetical protein
MQRYGKYEVDDLEYEKIKFIQQQNGSLFKEQTHGSRRKLYVNNRLIASQVVSQNLPMPELTQAQFVAFLGAFNRQLYSQFLKNESLFTLDITFKGISRDKNIDFWDTLKVGEYFYNVDLNSAYWQMLFRLGYIGEKFFLKYNDVPEYKEVKRYCVSFLARPNKMTYKTKDGEFVIECDISVLYKAYSNIRNELYCCIKKALTGVKNWLEYNIDGVSVTAEDLNAVQNNLKQMNLAFKITQCRKVSETDYIYGHKERKFKNR